MAFTSAKSTPNVSNVAFEIDEFEAWRGAFSTGVVDSVAGALSKTPDFFAKLVVVSASFKCSCPPP